VVISIDGRSVVDLGFADAINSIRGPEGTQVILGVRREGEGLEIRAVRRLVRG
jgi:carboxyl-terminal processing protease